MRKNRYSFWLLLALAWLQALAAQAQNTGPALLRRAAQLEAAGQLEAAANAYTQAATAFQAAGDKTAAAAAYSKSASASERNADQLLAGTKLAAPVAPVARPVAAAARPVAAAPAARPAAATVGPALLPGSTAGGKPVGMFFFVSSSDFNNQRTYYFTPAGQVYMNPIDFSAAGLAALNPRQRGRYAVSGKQMTITWADGSTTTGNYHADPSGFSCEGSFMCVTPLISARQLLGTFEGRNAAATVDANTLTAFNTLAFNTDGTFTHDGFTAAHLESRHSDKTALTTDVSSTAAQQAGRWRLDGWYLTLTDARGTVRGVAFRTDWDEKTDQTKRLRFNGTSYQSTARP